MDLHTPLLNSLDDSCLYNANRSCRVWFMCALSYITICMHPANLYLLAISYYQIIPKLMYSLQIGTYNHNIYEKLFQLHFVRYLLLKLWHWHMLKYIEKDCRV